MLNVLVLFCNLFDNKEILTINEERHYIVNYFQEHFFLTYKQWKN